MLDVLDMPARVSAAFEEFTDKGALREVRGLILKEAERLGVGPVEETLKWGQPAYLVKTGTTIRLGMLGGAPAVFVHCQTSIIETARELFESVAEFSSNRAVILGGDPRAVAHVICAALTYHQRST